MVHSKEKKERERERERGLSFQTAFVILPVCACFFKPHNAQPPFIDAQGRLIVDRTVMAFLPF